MEEAADHHRVRAEGHPGRETLHVFPADPPGKGILEDWHDED